MNNIEIFNMYLRTENESKLLCKRASHKLFRGFHLERQSASFNQRD
jgi:hypothetical protein